MKIIKLEVDENFLENGFGAVALVNAPAIEVNFMAFSKPKEYTDEEIFNLILMDELGIEEPTKQLFSFNDDKQVITGPLMIPNKFMIRQDATNDGKPYYTYFDEEGIRKVSYKMMKEKKLDQVNSEHDPNSPLAEVFMIESWIVEDPKTDKSTSMGYDLPKGTWMASYKVEDPSVWADVKTGKYLGFSIEGLFYNKIITE